MKVLVTGGAGFIGSELCRRLLSERAVASVRVIDDLSTGFETNLAGVDVDFRQASILDDDALADASRGVDAIVHLAALGSVPRSVLDPVRSHAVNATGTLRVLEAARHNGGSYVVLASSSSVYGANPALPKSEEQVCMPMSPYAVSKLATEQYAVAFAECYDLPVLPFRFFNVYGPRQMPGHAYAAVIPAFMEAALMGRPLQVHGDGKQSRDFTFVGTVTDILTRAVVERVTASPTNLAFGTRTSLLDLIHELAALVGHELEIDWQQSRKGDVRESSADNTRLKQLFDSLSPVPLQEGLSRTMDWMRSELR